MYDIGANSVGHNEAKHFDNFALECSLISEFIKAFTLGFSWFEFSLNEWHFNTELIFSKLLDRFLKGFMQLQKIVGPIVLKQEYGSCNG